MSSPAKTMRPASGRSSPASWPMKVVLPAPLGPITACISPSRTSKSMPSLARRAPYLFVRPRTSSMRTLEDAGQAALEENDGEHEERAEDRLPVLGPAFEDFLGDEQRECPDHRPRGAGDAAEDHHEHEIARLHPAREAGRDVVRMVRIERTGEPAGGAGDDERGEGGGADRDRPLCPAAGDAVESEDADRVGTEAEIRGVTERHHAAVTEDQVEAGCGDGEDHHAPYEVDVERLAERTRDGRQRREDERRHDPEERAARHRLWKRPAGLSASTTAISR